MEKKPLQYEIGGMHCAACSSRIERVVSKLPGVDKVSVNLASKKAKIWPKDDQDPDLESAIINKVVNLGFTASPISEVDMAERMEHSRKEAARERRLRLHRLVPMVILSLPLLFVSMGHMAGIPLPAWLEPHQSPRVFILVQLALTLPIVWLGRHFYIDGIGALMRHAPNMDSLVAVGTGAAFIYSLINALLGLAGNEPIERAMNLYFESCAVLLAMIEFGQFLEFTAKRKASDAMGALMSLTPDSAVRLEQDGQAVEVPLSQIETGDRLVVRPGTRVPVDGTILEGNTAIDLSLLTGESIPVSAGPGDKLVAGSLNGEGSVIMIATAVGQDTKLSRIMRLVEEAQGSKAPIARLADKVSYYFVPAVMLFAVLAASAWLLFSSQPYTVALTVFVAVLVMACPCAMGLATPMSIMVGTGRGAQLGVLIKNGAALEQAGQINILCVDKTGTLTTGKPALTAIIPSKNLTLSDLDLLGMAASLEGRSEHPLGLAIIEAAKSRNCEYYQVLDPLVKPGLGISGAILYKDIKYGIGIGNEAFMAGMGLMPDNELRKEMKTLADAGNTPLLMALGEENSSFELVAILALADQLRPETPAVISELKKMRIKVIMLTGDNQQTADAIAVKAGVESVAAQLLPAQKAEYIRALQKEGAIVGMVGDGLNDAPALASAQVGLAVGDGVDVSAEAGDVVLMRGGMQAVLTALELSRTTMRNIKQNLGWAFGYNILGLPVAAGLLFAFGGPMLSPMIAGLAMALSSFSVVTNALRLRWFQVSLPDLVESLQRGRPLSQ